MVRAHVLMASVVPGAHQKLGASATTPAEHRGRKFPVNIVPFASMDTVRLAVARFSGGSWLQQFGFATIEASMTLLEGLERRREQGR